MATHSSILAWRIPGTVEPGGLPSNGVAQSRTQLKRLSSSSSKAREGLATSPLLRNFWHAIHGHHQMVNTEIRLIIFFAAMTEKLYTVSKTRLGADYGSDHELLIAKFRLKLKKVGKTERRHTETIISEN